MWPRTPQRPFQSFVAADEWSANEVRIASAIATWRCGDIGGRFSPWQVGLHFCCAGVMIVAKKISLTDAGQTHVRAPYVRKNLAPRTMATLSSFFLLRHRYRHRNSSDR